MEAKDPLKLINNKERYIKHPVGFLLILSSSNACPGASLNVKISDNENFTSEISPSEIPCVGEFLLSLHTDYVSE